MGTDFGRCLEAVAAAQRCFESALPWRKLGYVKDRFFGYCPPGVGYATWHWDQVKNYLTINKGFTDEELVDAGLCKVSESGRVYDVFRDRITFPVFDIEHGICGFTARDVSSPKYHRNGPPPKYMNSPSSEIFDKKRCFAGVDFASLTPDCLPVICEGPFDAWALTIATGGKMVGLASMGTRLSETQAQFLASIRPDHRVLICRDNDAAGFMAAANDYQELLKAGVKEMATIAMPSQFKDLGEWKTLPNDYATNHVKLSPAWLPSLKHWVTEGKPAVWGSDCDLRALEYISKVNELATKVPKNETGQVVHFAKMALHEYQGHLNKERLEFYGSQIHLPKPSQQANSSGLKRPMRPPGLKRIETDILAKAY